MSGGDRHDRARLVGLPSAALGAAEIALNQYLGADEGALARARALAGRSLSIGLTDLGLAITFVAEGHGVQVVGQPEDEPDVYLAGRSRDFARVFFEAGSDGIMGAGLRIEGDIGIAQQFADLFARVDFDLGDLLDARFGPVAGHLIERGLSQAHGLLSRLRAELPAQAAEYLREETHDVVGTYEQARLHNEVTALADDVERAHARAARAERNR